MARFYASSGGGIRVGATFGALLEGERQGKFSPSAFDYYIGTSAGALDAVLTANGWTAEQKCRMFLDNDFGRCFTPPLLPYGLRKLLALIVPMSLDGLKDFYASLGRMNPYGPAIRFTPNLYINTVDAEENIQVVYCTQVPDWAAVETDPENGKLYSYRISRQGDKKRSIRWDVNAVTLPEALTRSAALPGLVADDPRYMDGGLTENPLLTAIPVDADILLIHLGYAGLVPKKGKLFPQGFIDRFLYSYEIKSFTLTEHLIKHFENISLIYPGVYDVDTAAFDLNRSQKQRMLDDAAANAESQWRQLA